MTAVIQPQSTQSMPAGANQSQKRTVALPQVQGDMVVDIWDARQPSGQPPLLLIHGWGGSGSYWTDTARALSETVTVIVPDLLGTGRSMPVRQPLNMYDQVASLVQMLDALNIGPVQVVGHSMGSAMGLLLADSRPEQVTRIVMTSMCFFLDEKQEQMYRSVMKIATFFMQFRPGVLADIPGMPWLMATRYFYRVPSDRDVLRQGLADYLELDYATAVACSKDATDPTITEAGANLKMPTLLVACRQDQVMPVSNVDYTASVIPDCNVAWINRCGHLPMVEKPAEYLAILQDFLCLHEKQAQI